jgi:hypothetical protein
VSRLSFLSSSKRRIVAEKTREGSNAKGTSVRSDISSESGVDQTVRRLARLKKAAGIAEEIYGDTLATLEYTRAQVNVQFLAEMEQAEKRDAERYDRPTTR